MPMIFAFRKVTTPLDGAALSRIVTSGIALASANRASA